MKTDEKAISLVSSKIRFDMTPKDAFRAVLHFPVGVFVAWLAAVSWSAALVFGLGFLTYEVAEDWRIKDHSFKDIFGYLLGMAVGAVLFSYWLKMY